MAIQVLIVVGTRPEAIKMIPIKKYMDRCSDFECYLCVTGQHRDMLAQVLKAFDIVPDFDLDLMTHGQTLTDITVKVLYAMQTVLTSLEPDIVLVHGDTNTAFAAALACFYRKIRVGHVEAGLRTYRFYTPYPEEMNRNLLSKLATYHFAPTEHNRCNLLREGVSSENIVVTGNTSIDTLQYTIHRNYVFENLVLNGLNYESDIVIVLTTHRNENIGEPMLNIYNAVRDIVNKHKNCIVVFPMHKNPAVRVGAYEVLGGVKNIILLEPLNVFDMHNLMAKCHIIMTDSGGIQEEGVALGKPVLVLRSETERTEAVHTGGVKVVGTNKENIIGEVKRLISNEDEYKKMSSSASPYGDGHASEKICNALLRYYTI